MALSRLPCTEWGVGVGEKSVGKHSSRSADLKFRYKIYPDNTKKKKVWLKQMRGNLIVIDRYEFCKAILRHIIKII